MQIISYSNTKLLATSAALSVLFVASNQPQAVQSKSCSQTTSKEVFTLPTNWYGNYYFDEFVPPNQNMSYSLVIMKAKDGVRARLKVDGFQTLIRAQGPVVIDGNKCTVIFESNYTDKSLNVPVEDSFKPNNVLFVLEKRDGKLITHWGKLSPLELVHQKPGFYFKRQSEIIHTN